MQNLKRFDERVTIGGIPDAGDLARLRELGYRTIVDLRDEEERLQKGLDAEARDLGLRFHSIPIRRQAIEVEDVLAFYRAVYERGAAPVYAFSLFGKRPLALLLLFRTVARGEPLNKIFHAAARFRVNLEGDLALRSFLVEIFNSGRVEPVVESVRALRPDLFDSSP